MNPQIIGKQRQKTNIATAIIAQRNYIVMEVGTNQLVPHTSPGNLRVVHVMVLIISKERVMVIAIAVI